MRPVKGENAERKWNLGGVDKRYTGGGYFFWAERCLTFCSGHFKWEMFFIFSRATDPLEFLLQIDLNSFKSPFTNLSNMCLALFGRKLSLLPAWVMKTGHRNCSSWDLQLDSIAQQMWRPRVLKNKKINRDVMTVGSIA